MAAATSEPTGSRPDAFSGMLLAAGSLTLFIGTLFYMRLTWRLGLPASPAERSQALADALLLGPQRLLLAGGWSFAGDCLLLAACLTQVRRRPMPGAGLASVGWALMGVSVALALIFDSMTAVLFWPLAHGSDSGLFLIFKTWFDFLFGAADVPYGLGLAAVLWADARSDSPLLPKPLSFAGVATGAAAAVSGFGYVMGLLHLPLVIGFTVTLGCVVLATLGVQIARSGQTVVPATEISRAAHL